MTLIAVPPPLFAPRHCWRAQFRAPKQIGRQREQYPWSCALLSSDGTLLLQAFSMDELDKVIRTLTEWLGLTVRGRVCQRIRIFGDPERAPAELRERFQPNAPLWEPGKHVLLERSA